MRDVDAAWLAGLFEGEGYVGNGPHSVGVTIVMCDRDVLERVDHLFPSTSGVRPMQGTYLTRKPAYRWSIHRSARVREFLTLILPWLGERRSAKAREILSWLDTRPGYGARNKQKTHCPRGHPYDMFEGGCRGCRRCKREFGRISQAKRRAAQRAAPDP